MNGAVVLLSGGLDSTVLVTMMSEKYRVHALSFDYGQRHSKELFVAADTAQRLGIPHDIIDVATLGRLFWTSSLTNQEMHVPEGHYAADNMKKTVVPNRNMIMLSMAVGVAISDDASVVAFAAHAGDHDIYPDCRLPFVDKLEMAVLEGNQGFVRDDFSIIAPFISMTKADLVSLGSALNVPFAKTWSCYKGGQIHCGKCGTCVERAEAFALASIKDPTVYEDPNYWMNVKNPTSQYIELSEEF